MLERLEVDGYRSLRDLAIDFGQVTVVTGPNGAGKTNIYRALQLAQGCAAGDVAARVAAEGGMSSVVWAGPRRQEPRVHLAVIFDGLYYEASLATIGRGAVPSSAAFPLDPVITAESIQFPDAKGRPVELMERRGATAFVRDEQGHRVSYAVAFHESESVLSQMVDPRQYPELFAVRSALLRMRFHHQLRTDEHSPARQRALGTRTLAVADDGADLAAAIATIERDGDREALDRCVADAFSGARVSVHEDDSGHLELQLDTRGSMFRSLQASELSDGQLRFLFLAAVLLALRPPDVVVLNEPESSLHRDLLPALAELIELAAVRTQIVLTTHADELVSLLRPRPDAEILELELVDGATRVRRR